MAQRSRACNWGVKRHKSCRTRRRGLAFSWPHRTGSYGSPAYQPMYWPPFADRFAPVIQAASSGMKKATA